MAEFGALLMGVLRSAWQVLAALLVVLAGLAMLYRVAEGAAAASIGGSDAMANALAAGGAVLTIALFGFLGVPALSQAVRVSVGTCGPMDPALQDMGNLAAGLVGGLAALRMLAGAVQGVLAAGMGAPHAMSQAIVTCAEALVGMAIAVVIVPLAAAFLTC
jgi:hypothetical protein